MSDEEPEFVSKDDFRAHIENLYPGIEVLSEVITSNPAIATLYMASQAEFEIRLYALLSASAGALLADDPRTTPWELLQELADESSQTSQQWVKMRVELGKLLRTSGETE